MNSGAGFAWRDQIEQRVDQNLQVVKGQATDPEQAARIDRCRSILEFNKTYLPHLFEDPWGAHHVELAAAIDQPGKGKRIVRAEPRKFGKTTFLLGAILKKLAYREKHFILLVGETATTAEGNLATITQEAETNTLLRTDFPHLDPMMDTQGKNVRWRDNWIVTRAGQSVVAKGMGASMRGLVFLGRRPDMAVGDDLESPETTDVFSKRRRSQKWFGGTFLGLGGKLWDVYLIGNLVHHEGLVAVHLRAENWDGLVFRAYNTIPKQERTKYKYPIGNKLDDGSPLWPSQWSEAELESYRNEPTVGNLVFAREMMNDPREDKDLVFYPDRFTYFDYTGLEGSEGEDLYSDLATYIDPAGGESPSDRRKGKKDWAAIITGGRRRGSNLIDVIDVKLTRALPTEQISLLLDTYEDFGSRIGGEENIWKNLLGPLVQKEAQARGLYPSIQPRHEIRNKKTKILATEPLISSGTVRFAAHLRDLVPEYFDQYEGFPSADYDDGPDATEGMIRMLEDLPELGGGDLGIS